MSEGRGGRSGRNPTQAGFDESTVRVWGWHQFPARGSGAGIPRFDQFTWDRLNKHDLGPPDWKADHWTAPEMVESVQMVVDWVLKDKIQPRSSLTYNLEDADNKFVSGVSATYQFGTHRYGSWREKMQFPPEDAVWARYPTWDGKRWGPVMVNHWSMGVSNKSKYKDQAIELTDVLDVGRTPTWSCPTWPGSSRSRTSITEQHDLRSPGPLVRASCSSGGAEWSAPLYNPPVRPSDIYIQAYHQMVNESVPVQKALGDARDAYNKLLAEIPADKLPK